MPLDSHSYLVAQGWTGKGTGLRHGAISRPLAIPQKKNLAGLGKDRDEAFPFWDHLFSAAAKSIQLKVGSNDGDEFSSGCSTPTLKRTATGILSNRRPVTEIPASTDTNTPVIDKPVSRPSLLSTAKREAAKAALYARFFRGPLLNPDDDDDINISETIGIAKTEPDSGDQGITQAKPRKRRKVDGADDSDQRERTRQKKDLKRKLRQSLAVASCQNPKESIVNEGLEVEKEGRLLRKERKRRKKELKEGYKEELMIGNDNDTKGKKEKASKRESEGKKGSQSHSEAATSYEGSSSVRIHRKNI